MRNLLAILLSVVFATFMSRAENCPPNAVTTGFFLSMAAYRTNGVPIGNGTVQVGETICFTSAVIFLPLNLIDYLPNASFSGGTMSIAGRDVTPLNGVRLLGYEECGGASFASSRRFERQVTLADAMAGSIYVTGRYTNGLATAAVTVQVRVKPPVGPALKAPTAPSRKRTAARPQRPKPSIKMGSR